MARNIVILYGFIFMFVCGCNQMSSVAQWAEDMEGDASIDLNSDIYIDFVFDTDTDFDDEVFFDTNTSLAWQISSPEETYTCAEAYYYCDTLDLGEYDDWRLPTITELRTIITGCPASETNGACAVADDSTSIANLENCAGCESFGGPGLGGCYFLANLSGVCGAYWSSTVATDNDVIGMHYQVRFNDASIIYSDESPYIRCVRTM